MEIFDPFLFKVCYKAPFSLHFSFSLAVITYVAVGMIYNRLRKGATGLQLIPHYDFWFSFMMHVLVWIRARVRTRARARTRARPESV